MRMHIAGLPHVSTVKADSQCAYIQKTRRMANMMTSLGHEIILYAGADNDAACTELVNCQRDVPALPGIPAFTPSDIRFMTFNGAVIREMAQRIRPGDLILIIGGTAQEPIARAFPANKCVEFGIGYGGTFAEYRVFESAAWQHCVYGATAILRGQDVHGADGRENDVVIPNYFEPEDFPFSAEKDDYYLFIGRLIDRKGYMIAVNACRERGVRLIVAGAGVAPPYGDYVGVVGPEERGRLMSRARAVFVPTQYVEPFGGVAVESMLCGSPVITSAHGAFVETVQDGVTGIRCHRYADYLEAMDNLGTLAPAAAIRDYAVGRYSCDVVKHQYQKYFECIAAA